LQFALSFGADIEVIEPVELRDKDLDAARSMVERHTSPVYRHAILS
jgi:predicted DNA-binding transcriptional regulator YafY